ncbi:MAG: PH domain-containing protein [Thermoplasmata archaeon]|nr:PH domain-containing protein [Thermoplasmata archaeon]MCI4338646.1 PH domain-containing protein [Thermoplasmata archaeon]MCI4341493.1 PH domain-containing protein [Thermoplasmata archaeon]
MAGTPPNSLIFRMPAAKSMGVIVFYILLMLIVLGAEFYSPSASYVPYLYPLLEIVLLLFLLRYATTGYRVDGASLYASRILGGRRIPLEQIRKIQYANLRELGPMGITMSFGWRGRGWSPTVGKMDSISTVSRGLLVTAGEVPIFISPVDAIGFRRELSRRVRSAPGGELSE